MDKTNRELFDKESPFEDIISYISFTVNIISFFLFYININRHKNNSNLQTAFMINSIFYSILNYLSIVYSNKELFIIEWSKLTSDVFYPYLTDKIVLLPGISTNSIFPTIAVILFCEILISLELTQIVKNPVKTKSFRMTLFIFFILIYLIAMIIYASSLNDPTDPTDHVERDIALFIGFYITYPILILIAIWAILIIIIVHSTASLMFSNRKLKFCIFHCASIWFVIIIIAYPFYLSVSNVMLKDQLRSVLLFMNICSLMLNGARIIEVYIIKISKSKKIKQMKKQLELFQMQKSNTSINVPLIPSENSSTNSKESSDNGFEKKEKDDKESEPDPDDSYTSPKLSDSTFIDITVLSQNNFLYECFVYLIRGMLQIATIESGKNLQYNIKPQQYFESRSHKYQIENKVIQSITTSQPRRRRFWNQFLKQFKIFSKKVHLVEYAPEIFRNIRSFNKINEQELKLSFDLERNLTCFSNYLLESEGKSGSLFFLTYDYKFIFKTISERERKTLTHNFLQPYYELLAVNNSTSLSRIYGAYVLNIGMIKINFILMENISPFSPETIIYKFDLKGSELGRSTKSILQNTNKTLKDMDYSELSFKQPAATININDLDIARIKESLVADLNFLENTHLMDYSLFIAIMDNTKDIIKKLSNYDEQNKRYYVSQDKKYIYLFGIIDYLTKYDKWKNLENKYLRLRHLTGEQTFSAIEPSSYRMRFYNFLVGKVFLTTKQKNMMNSSRRK